MMIDLRLLRVLRVLQVQGTVTATARTLSLSPSAVSQQLRQLSCQAGAELLERDGRTLRLTAAGDVLVRHADALYAQWEHVRAELGDHGGDSGTHRTLRLGGFSTSIGSLLVPAARTLRDGPHPVTTLLIETDTDACYERLLSGELDIALLTPLPGGPSPQDTRFEHRSLLVELQDLAVPVDHRLAGRASVELRDAEEEDWICGHPDQNRLTEALCTAAGFAPRMTHHATEWRAVLDLVAAGLGVSLVPRLVPSSAHPRVVRVPVTGDPLPLRRVLTCVRRGSAGQSAIARGLAALCEAAVHACGSTDGRTEAGTAEGAPAESGTDESGTDESGTDEDDSTGT